MKALALIFSILLGLLGLVFVAGHQGQTMRIVAGIILLGAAAAFTLVVRMKPEVHQQRIVQKLDLSGDVSLEKMKCKQCGGKLSGDSVSIEAGAVLVSCPYCNTSYHLEEAPKW